MIFADDIGIIADTRSALTKAIAIIEEWCLKNKMELNKRKSFIVFIKTKWYKSQTPTPKYIKSIKVVPNAKYLGIYIDETLNFQR